MSRYEWQLERMVSSLGVAVSKVMETHTGFINDFLELDRELDDIAKTIGNRKLKEMRSPFIDNLLDLKWKIEDMKKFLEVKRGD